MPLLSDNKLEISSTVFFALSTHDVWSAHPLLRPKVMWEGIYVYSICPPFTTGLLPVTYAATTTAGKYVQMLMALTVSHICQSLLADLQQASVFHEVCRCMALPTKTTPSSASNLTWDLPLCCRKCHAILEYSWGKCPTTQLSKITATACLPWLFSSSS